MSAVTANAWAVLLGLIPAAAIFGFVAVFSKRGGVMAALQACRRETITNLCLTGINSVLLAGLFYAITQAAHTRLGLFPGLEHFWMRLPEPWLLLLALLIDDFVVYWRHRAEHLPALWPIHATHHSDEAMTWLSLLRKHPLSKLFSMFIDAIPLVVLGFPAWAIAASAFVRLWWGYFIHADLPWTLGPVGKVLLSPAAHRLHHIRDEEHMGQNYAGFFTIWDRAFGTFNYADGFLNCETGIAGGSRSLAGELARPFEWIKHRAHPAAQRSQS